VRRSHVASYADADVSFFCFCFCFGERGSGKPDWTEEACGSYYDLQVGSGVEAVCVAETSRWLKKEEWGKKQIEKEFGCRKGVGKTIVQQGKNGPTKYTSN